MKEEKSKKKKKNRRAVYLECVTASLHRSLGGLCACG
jgi:hypothetical protein